MTHDRPTENVPQWLLTTAGWSWRFVALVVAVSLLVYAVVHVRLVFVAVFLALVLTSVLKPLADFYGRVMPRALAVGLAFLSAIVFFGGLVTYVVASVAGQWQTLVVQFTNGIDQIIDWAQHGPLPINVSWDHINDAIDSGREWVADNSDDLASTAVASVGTVAEGFAVIALSVFCTVFFLMSGGAMWRWFLTQVPAGHRERWAKAADAGWYSFSGYARGTVIIAVTDGIMAGILLAALGIPLAAPLAVLVFIGAFIPLIGAPAAMVIAGVVALAAEGPVKALIVIIGVALIGQIEGHLLQPLIMGKQVALHPVVIALGVTAGTVLAGILGAVVAVPVLAVTWTVYSTLRPRRADEVDPGQEEGEGEGADESV
ncbi:AI-2E family transporter [Xylanimonas ulmi]|uniref:Putative PurR-regulated permease PerM n=1 Tax=Xylanimonas ulmi TaxID=228973 RepID=A0A4Q7M3M0_9MICO|nr:AI-2E family transporter [Xylanibacterium ulmi]RZS60549.1 putative PurR-regulated permease PerM [Xylanibacterium ulmi]